jgi:hypothetical protein
MAKARLWTVGALLGAGLLAAASVQAQEAPKTIKIGYAISKTGPNAGGANITQIPNYQLWVKEVNDKGGLMLKAYGKRIPIEVIEYDDRSNSDEVVRAVERLVTQDKVDLLFPPWGTGFNLAVGPVFNKYGYPAPSPIRRRHWPSVGPTASGCSAPRRNMSTLWWRSWSSSGRRRRSATTSPWCRSPTASALICRKPRARA